MGYAAPISRDHPTCLLFIIDQSTSMNMRMSIEKSKAQFLADVLNKTLYTLIVSCTKAEGIRNYFEIGVIAYSGTAVHNGFQGPLAQRYLNPISSIAGLPLRIEERKQRFVAADESVSERIVKFPIWIEPVSRGKTNMCAAFRQAVTELRCWSESHPDSYPPTVLHVTDGHPTDGDPEPLAEEMKRIRTRDGETLVFNLHVDIGGHPPIIFPSAVAKLSDRYAHRLFRMSSQLPIPTVRVAAQRGIVIEQGGRGFMFNGDAKQIVDFFDIGTRATIDSLR
jgi:hypothetical protein